MAEKALEKSESSNIFDELGGDTQDLDKLEAKNKRDVYFYIALIGGFLKFFNVFLIISILVFFLYTTIQNSEQDINLSFLEPICFVFLGEVSEPGACSGVNSKYNSYSSKLDEIKKNQFSKISGIIGDLYSSENFVYSKEVTFLLDKSKSRVLPLDVLTAFDSVKTAFEPYEKSKIKCFDLTIYADNVVEVTCEAYSSDWDREIVGFDGEKVNTTVEGTSISLANSFINFIEKSSTHFSVLEKQKIFTSHKVTDSSLSYTRSTVFTLKLLYNNNNL